MIPLAAHLWTMTDELDFMRDYQRWDLRAINRARVNVGMGELATRQDALRAYGRGLRRRVKWDDVVKRVDAVGSTPERFDPLSRYDIEKLVSAPQEIVAQIDARVSRFPWGV